ncbi:MAG: YceI family protein, partial [Kordiimonas sp.]
NERMREFFFKTVNFPTATITTALSPADYSDMAIGSRSIVSLSAQLNLHGVSSDIEFDAFVTRIADDKFAVDTAAPILLDVDEFELGSGLDKLKELAGLDVISPIVPVTASLVFEK